MTAWLKEEGHKIVAGMDCHGFSVSRNEGGFVAELVTATPNLQHWYMVKGDQPLGTKPSRFCVATKGQNLEINDHRRGGPPRAAAAALFGVNVATLRRALQK